MNSYEINEETLAIVPETDRKSRVYEVDGDFIVNRSAKEIMEDSCGYFGSSLKGRSLGTKRLTGVNYKAPVIVEETKEIIFFPTTSPRNMECAWISLAFVDNYFEMDSNVCIIFKNGKSVLLPVSYYVINHQILRSSRLQNILRARKEGKG